MRRVVTGLLFVGMIAVSANGATLSMCFSGGNSHIVAMPGETVEIEIHLTVSSNELVKTVFFGNNEAPFYQIAHTGVEFDQIAANPAAVNLQLGVPGQQAQFQNSAGPVGYGSYLIGTQTIHLGYDAGWGYYNEISFNHESVGILDEIGRAFIYDPEYANVWPDVWAYGDYGAPENASGSYGSQDYNPLVVYFIPEPTSLALVLLGGVFLNRRRR